jgi:hypothetical protein
VASLTHQRNGHRTYQGIFIIQDNFPVLYLYTGRKEERGGKEKQRQRGKDIDKQRNGKNEECRKTVKREQKK